MNRATMTHHHQLTIPGLGRQPHAFAPELVSTDATICVRILGLRLVNETNAREHWAVRAKRAKSQRMVVKSALGPRPNWASPPLRIVLTRLGRCRMDTGNLGASCKHVQDGVADWLGVDDGSPLLDWHYRQLVDHAGGYGVLVRIERWDGRPISLDNSAIESSLSATCEAPTLAGSRRRAAAAPGGARKRRRG